MSLNEAGPGPNVFKDISLTSAVIQDGDMVRQAFTTVRMNRALIPRSFGSTVPSPTLSAPAVLRILKAAQTYDSDVVMPMTPSADYNGAIAPVAARITVRASIATPPHSSLSSLPLELR